MKKQKVRMLWVSGSEDDCVMCGDEAEYLAEETNEPLCRKCNAINEQIKHTLS